MDTIIRAYTRLVGLKNNLPKEKSVKENYIREYHEIVNLLEREANADLGEFKIPETEIQREVTSTSFYPSFDPYIGGKGHIERSYSEDKYCETALFLSKLDALLSYFQIRYLSDEKTEMGFQSPE